MKASTIRRIVYKCSFCGQPEAADRRLIANGGPASRFGTTFICSECIERYSSASKLPKPTEGECWFCGLPVSYPKITYLSIGPGGQTICNQCLNLCHEIIEEELAGPGRETR